MSSAAQLGPDVANLEPPSTLLALHSTNLAVQLRNTTHPPVKGVVPIMDPLTMPMPSDRKAHIWPGNSMVSLRKPAAGAGAAVGMG